MSEWIISIVGVIMLGVLLEIVLPDGKTAKYVKGAFSLLVVLAIAAPLPRLFKTDFKSPSDASVEIDSAYVAETYDGYGARLSVALEKYLEGEGIDAVVTVRVSEGKIERVKLLVSPEQASAAEDAVLKRLNIDKSCIDVVKSDVRNSG